MNRFRHLVVLSALAFATLAPLSVIAATPAGTPLPAWEQLTPAQRDLLIAPIRERWNANPDERAHFYERAQRWQQMTPAQRASAHHGEKRWEGMRPEQREQMRALFQKMRAMTPTQRRALRDQWHGMTTEQRKAWVDANPPPPR